MLSFQGAAPLAFGSASGPGPGVVRGSRYPFGCRGVASVLGVDGWALVEWRLWGKSRGLRKRYPVACHGADAAAAAWVLWEVVLSASQRGVIARGMGVTGEHARRLVALWAGLHDLGKITAVFQQLDKAAFAELEHLAGYPVDGSIPQVRHDLAGQIAVAPLLAELGAARARRWRASPQCVAAQVIGGHHGCFHEVGEREARLYRWPEAMGEQQWAQQRRLLVEHLHTALGAPPMPVTFEVPAAALVAGVVVLADWLVSQLSFITARQDDPARTVAQWYAGSLAAMPEVIREAGLGQAVVAATEVSAVWGFAPNALQRSVQQQLATGVKGAGLLVVTAAPGDGKTETALVAASMLGQAAGVSGVVFALPTMATADQMHTRVRQFTQRAVTGPSAVTLVHSMSRLHLATGSGAGMVSDESAVARTALQWLYGAKRGLLAPMSVITVDQALMAVLPVRHNVMRLLGLSGKVVVIDEAHAYDAYMQSLLATLLTWLGHYRVPVVLLSATLPRVISDALINAYLRGSRGKAHRPGSFAIDYPGWLFVDAAGGDTVRPSPAAVAEMAVMRTSTLAVDLINVPESPENSRESRSAVLGELLTPLRVRGGRVAVVCNTVDSAQATFEDLLEWAGEEVEVSLLHARLPDEDRAAVAADVLTRHGKGPRRKEKPSIVVATQLIEQSLDVDFDLVITDVAPVAQLLQRAGRCHRHERPERERGAWPGQARLVVLVPVEESGEFAMPPVWRSIYPRYLLERTLTVLRARQGKPVAIPGEVSGLVGEVYDEFSMDQDDQRWWTEYEGQRLAQRDQAGWVMVPEAGVISRLEELSQAPVVDAGLLERREVELTTRLGADTQRVVCCFVDDQGRRWLDRNRWIALPGEHAAAKSRPSAAVIRMVMGCSIPVRASLLNEHCDSEAARLPASWENTPWLGDLRIIPLPLTEAGSGSVVIGRRRFSLDDRLGLVVTKLS
ncbi:CRISPR-associated helicase Cas3' [Crossiella sp. SN42]|uniref:CRISPR-associated helicase Cas3' n=1 Tax=Crossiella sp. SN42 TaxID=2944808 RepID=UPI00207C8A09|nr:CRISPR-associated helicase Cas3' [Crossiella sp. SN42]MCO1575833.1 CRISPR-associated helicase Cas3' [Crossiella sp. SN42]